MTEENKLSTIGQQTAAKPIHILTAQLDSRRENFSLPSTISFDAFKNTLIAACSKDPKLLQADRASLMLACVNAAADGLLPNGREAALVLFGGKVQYMPMVAGVLKKLRNSGELATIFATVVYEGDEFQYELGSSPRLVHKPTLKDRGDVICAYARATLKDGSEQFEVLHWDDIMAIKKASRSSGSGPWVQWFDEMAKKSALRRLSKYLPSSTDVQQMFEREDETGPGLQSPAPAISLPEDPEDHDIAGAVDGEVIE